MSGFPVFLGLKTWYLFGSKSGFGTISAASVKYCYLIGFGRNIVDTYLCTRWLHYSRRAFLANLFSLIWFTITSYIIGFHGSAAFTYQILNTPVLVCKNNLKYVSIYCINMQILLKSWKLLIKISESKFMQYLFTDIRVFVFWFVGLRNFTLCRE